VINVAVFVSNPDGVYSGGRYHGLMLTEALATLDTNVHYVTNLLPVFWSEFQTFPAHSKIHCCFGWNNAAQNLPKKLDYLFVVPGTSDDSFYQAAIDIAKSRQAKIVMINFESENWFNKYAPVKKNSDKWAQWRKVASASKVVLSSAIESSKYAKEYYLQTGVDTVFAECAPPINTFAADSVVETNRDKRIILLARFSGDVHKGASAVSDLIDESISGYKLDIVVGTGVVPDKDEKLIAIKCKEFNVELSWHFKLSEVEKFRLYKKSELLLFPSYFEGYGYPPIEARYCGCKVVAFDLPVLRETCGDDIYLAQHGNFDDFRNKIAIALRQSKEPNGYRLKELAPLSSMAKVLNKLMIDNQQSTPDFSLYNTLYEKKETSQFSSKLRRKVSSCLVWGGKTLRKVFKKHQGIITYFPKFQTQEALANHFYRAAWYFPHSKNVVERVNFYTTIDIAGKLEIPKGMSDSNPNKSHLKMLKGKVNYLVDLLSSDVIMLTRGEDNESFWVKLLRLTGIPVVNIDTNDVNTKEYGDYPGTIWRYLIGAEERRDVILKSYKNFNRLAQKAKKDRVKYSAVFGTGPSLDNAFEYDFSSTFTVVCNSTVQNDHLLDHINPYVVTAGDAVSHFGVSEYANQFRKDLVRVLKERELYYFGTATFGYVLLLHFPELVDKFIFIDQKHDGPNHDLLANFSAPKLDSTMNIHMLPIAATFADDIFILGCDGKAPKVDNEDFWAHSKAAQYHDLVETGHICHPTFDIHRQKATYGNHLDSVRSTLEVGELEFHKRYTSLKRSYIPAFSERNLDSAWYESNFDNIPKKISIDKLASQLGEIPASSSDVNPSLEIKLSISAVSIENSEFSIKGWFLAPFANARILFQFDNGKEYFLPEKTKRPDIAKKFCEYNQLNSGIEFKCLMPEPAQKVKVQVLKGLELVHEKAFNI